MPWPIFFLILMNLRHRADVCRAAVQRDRDKKSCGRDRVWGQAQHVGDLQRGLIHVWNLYEFNIYTKKYDDSTESLMWWKGGKWSSYHHRSWKEETTVEDSPASEKRILRWVAYLQSFMAYLRKCITLFYFFSRRPERGTREQLWWNQRTHGRGDGNSKF